MKIFPALPGTVTRCHFDTYENLLTQVSTNSVLFAPGPKLLISSFLQVWGYKYVRLFAPEHGPHLYPIRGSGASGDSGDATTSQGNISAVDVESPDLVSHPLFALAAEAYVDAVLGPGDALYIPPGWWHYVRSLTPSFTVNFWF